MTHDEPADSVEARRFSLATHITENAGSVLYGAVVAAAATAIVSAKPATSSYVSLSVVLMLVVYSLAHLYAKVLGARLTQPGSPLWRRLRTEAVHEASVLEGGVPVLVCFALLRAAGAGVGDAAQGALWFTVALLAVIGYRIGRSLGATGGRLALEVAGAAAIGLLMIVLKGQLH